MRNLTACCLVAALLCVASSAKAQTAEADRITSLPLVNLTFKSNMYSGYLPTLGGRKTFYFFVESERDPTTDPLLVWSNGGPGCSSLLGAFTENGPIGIAHNGIFYNNPYTWSTANNMLFMEGPPGVGFSTDHNCRLNKDQTETINCTYWNDTVTAESNYASLRAWFDRFPRFKGGGRKLYLSGESYAGHYIPQLANQILYGEDKGINAMMRGFMVGNPCTGHYNGSDLDLCLVVPDPTLSEFYKGHAFLSFNDSQNTNETDEYGFVLGDDDYDVYDIEDRYCSWKLPTGLQADAPAVKKAIYRHGRRVAQWQKDIDEDLRDGKNEKEDRRMEQQATTNSRQRRTVPRYGPCAENYLYLWLNRDDVKRAMHAEADIHWLSCAVAFDYYEPENSESRGVLPLYRDFINNTNWNILVYSGDVDSVVNFIQTQKIIASLNRSVVNTYSPWYYRDQYNSSWMQVGGFYVQYDRISWASVKGAGHMVPTMKPAPAWQLLHSFQETGGPGLKPRLHKDVKPLPDVARPPPQTPKPEYIDRELSEVSPKVGFFFGGLLTGLMTGIIAVCCWAAAKKRKNLWGDDHK